MTSEEINWSLCCLCQTNDGREIRSPVQSKCKDRGAGNEMHFHYFKAAMDH